MTRCLAHLRWMASCDACTAYHMCKNKEKSK